MLEIVLSPSPNVFSELFIQIDIVHKIGTKYKYKRFIYMPDLK
jgi:hypothetical protein